MGEIHRSPKEARACVTLEAARLKNRDALVQRTEMEHFEGWSGVYVGTRVARVLNKFIYAH